MKNTLEIYRNLLRLMVKNGIITQFKIKNNVNGVVDVYISPVKTVESITLDFKIN